MNNMNRMVEISRTITLRYGIEFMELIPKSGLHETSMRKEWFSDFKEFRKRWKELRRNSAILGMRMEKRASVTSEYIYNRNLSRSAPTEL